jgi:hypothetical protein
MDELSRGAEVHFLEDAGSVGVDRGEAEGKHLGNLRDGPSATEKAEAFKLPVGELFVGQPGTIGLELRRKQFGHRGAHVLPSFCNLPDRGHEFLGGALLREVTGRAAPQAAHGVLLLGGGAEDQDLCRRHLINAFVDCGTDGGKVGKVRMEVNVEVEGTPFQLFVSSPDKEFQASPFSREFGDPLHRLPDATLSHKIAIAGQAGLPALAELDIRLAALTQPRKSCGHGPSRDRIHGTCHGMPARTNGFSPSTGTVTVPKMRHYSLPSQLDS